MFLSEYLARGAPPERNPAGVYLWFFSKSFKLFFSQCFFNDGQYILTLFRVLLNLPCQEEASCGYNETVKLFETLKHKKALKKYYSCSLSVITTNKGQGSQMFLISCNFTQGKITLFLSYIQVVFTYLPIY